jgi:hypothetical protein
VAPRAARRPSASGKFRIRRSCRMTPRLPVAPVNAGDGQPGWYESRLARLETEQSLRQRGSFRGSSHELPRDSRDAFRRGGDTGIEPRVANGLKQTPKRKLEQTKTGCEGGFNARTASSFVTGRKMARLVVREARAANPAVRPQFSSIGHPDRFENEETSWSAAPSGATASRGSQAEFRILAAGPFRLATERISESGCASCHGSAGECC